MSISFLESWYTSSTLKLPFERQFHLTSVQVSIEVVTFLLFVLYVITLLPCNGVLLLGEMDRIVAIIPECKKLPNFYMVHKCFSGQHLMKWPLDEQLLCKRKCTVVSVYDSRFDAKSVLMTSICGDQQNPDNGAEPSLARNYFLAWLALFLLFFHVGRRILPPAILCL